MLLSYGMTVSAEVSSTETEQSLNNVDSKESTHSRSIYGVGAHGYLSTYSGLVYVLPNQQTGSIVQEISVKEGDAVRKGQVLAKLSIYSLRENDLNTASKELELAKFNLESAKNNKNNLQKSLDRNRKLLSSKIVSDQAFEKIEKDFTDSEIDVQRMKTLLLIAQLKLQKCQILLTEATILSPMDGQILRINGKVGERINEQDGLLIMTDLSNMEVVAEVHESDIANISIGQKAQISFPNQAITMIGHVYYKAGMIHSNTLRDSDPKGSQDLRVVEVRLKLDPEDGKKVQEFLRMHVDVRFLPENKKVYDTTITRANETRAL